MLSKQSSVALERSCSTGAVPYQAWGGVPRLVVLVLGRSGAACWPKFAGRGNNGAGAAFGLARASTGLGWYYVHAEGSGATLQVRGQVTGTRGLHKDPALASYSPNCTF